MLPRFLHFVQCRNGESQQSMHTCTSSQTGLVQRQRVARDEIAHPQVSQLQSGGSSSSSVAPLCCSFVRDPAVSSVMSGTSEGEREDVLLISHCVCVGDSHHACVAAAFEAAAGVFSVCDTHTTAAHLAKSRYCSKIQTLRVQNGHRSWDRARQCARQIH